MFLIIYKKYNKKYDSKNEKKKKKNKKMKKPTPDLKSFLKIEKIKEI